jgi:hypothetical protein
MYRLFQIKRPKHIIDEELWGCNLWLSYKM